MQSDPPPHDFRRVSMGHAGVPSAVRTAGTPMFFLTVCAEDRSGAPLLPHAAAILDAARFYHEQGVWFARLFLVMPDHIHLLVRPAVDRRLSDMVCRWKRYLTRTEGIAWQRNFFDHRIRNEAEETEKWDYIRLNPVRRGLVADPDAWPHWFANR